MLSFFSKQKSAFGLEFSDSSLRAMQLRPLKNSFFPSAYVARSLPKGLISEARVNNPDNLSELIATVYKKPDFGEFDSPYAVISVPESKSFVRVITMPKMTEEEAKEAVPFEAEQYIPVSIDDVYMDFVIINEPNRTDGKMQVLITATPREIVDQYVNIVKKAKIKPVAMEVESEALARCLIPSKRRNDATLVVDIGNVRSSIIIYDKGSLQFTSSIPVAGSAFTTQLAQSLSVSPEEAEKQKVQIGLDPRKDSGQIKQILTPQIHSIVDAINNSINFYKEHTEGAPDIKKVILSGGGSKLKNLPELLDEELRKMRGIKTGRLVTTGDPWVNVFEGGMSKVPPISKGESIGFATVIGLALRAIENE